MARRERRQEARKITKELNKLKSDPILIGLMADETLAKTVKDNLPLLETGTYPDQDVQLKYGKVVNFISTVNQLESRLAFLKFGDVPKKDVTGVNK
jgi:hypothetical protein